MGHGINTYGSCGRTGVPTAVLREAFQASGLPATTVALRLGWFDSRNYPDSPRVHRVLGLRPDSDGSYRQRVRQTTAVRFADALELAPVDIGL